MKRKIHLSLCIGGMLIAQLAAGQAEFGAKAGVTFSDISVQGINLGTNFLDPQMIAGVQAGFYSEMPLGNGFYFAPELNYAQKGFRVQESMDMDVFGVNVPIGAEAVTRIHYIDAPLALKYKFGNRRAQGYLRAGPTMGYAVAGSVTTRLKSIVDIKVAEINLNPQGDLYNALEIGGLVGAGVEVPAGQGKFFVDATYTHGFSNIFDVPVIDLRVKNMGVGVGLGYAMNF